MSETITIYVDGRPYAPGIVVSRETRYEQLTVTTLGELLACWEQHHAKPSVAAYRYDATNDAVIPPHGDESSDSDPRPFERVPRGAEMVMDDIERRRQAAREASGQ